MTGDGGEGTPCGPVHDANGMCPVNIIASKFLHMYHLDLNYYHFVTRQAKDSMEKQWDLEQREESLCTERALLPSQHFKHENIHMQSRL